MSIYYSNPKNILNQLHKSDEWNSQRIFGGGGGGGEGVKGWGNGAKLYQETSCFDTNLREW